MEAVRRKKKRSLCHLAWLGLHAHTLRYSNFLSSLFLLSFFFITPSFTLFTSVLFSLPTTLSPLTLTLSPLPFLHTTTTGMADQAEILRKRREARQKKILESGESRLSKITGTSGTNAQVAPSPAVIQAREQLQKKEQEEERLKAMKAAVEAGTVPTIISAGDTDVSSEPGKKKLKGLKKRAEEEKSTCTERAYPKTRRHKRCKTYGRIAPQFFEEKERRCK